MMVTMESKGIKVLEWDQISEEFKKEFPITKDLQSLRVGKSGVMLEDIQDEIREKFGADELFLHMRKPDPKDQSVYRSESFGGATKNAEGTIGIKFFVARYGVPTVVVGCKTKEDWTKVQSYLREKGLIRLPRTT